MKMFHAVLFVALSLLLFVPATAVSFDYGYDYPGGELVGSYPGVSSAEQCSQMCSNNAACVAFTWVKPNIQGPTGVCWLKGSLSGKVANNCCVSGVVRPVRQDTCKWQQQGTTYTCYCQSSKTGKWYPTNPGACKDPKPAPRYIDRRKNVCPPGQVWVDTGLFGQGQGYCKPQ